MIEVRDLVVHAGPRTLLSGISLALPPGRLIAIIGPNGAGKSTLMKALAGEIAPDAGTVLLDGRDIALFSAGELARRRAVLPQASNLAFPFTVHEVVRLGVAHRLSPAAAGDRVRAALARVDLRSFGARLYQELSGGEQQRVHLARVLCQVWEPMEDGEPRTLFLDEPTASLDLRHQLMTLDTARSFARSGGGVIAILHDLNLAAAYADTVIVIEKGRVVAEGETDAILTADLMRSVFGVDVVAAVTAEGRRVLVPLSARAA